MNCVKCNTKMKHVETSSHPLSGFELWRWRCETCGKQVTELKRKAKEKQP